MTHFLSYSILMPPTIFIVLALVGSVLALRRPRAGIAVALGASLLLYLSAMPAVSSGLLTLVEAPIPRAPDLAAARAIVILGGDVTLGDDGAASDSVGPLTLQRLADGAALFRKTALPIAVSGGNIRGAHTTLAALMQRTLAQDFAIPTRWSETRSTTTFENALYTAPLLHADGVDTVIVVTQAWHMARALWSFERVGLHALPAPELLSHERADRIDDFLPDLVALHDTFYALHEGLGLVYYRLRY